tara:strand:+ start:440 stop:2413 length:1974 start_codon:yes stop_codon:yes gene_type:complete
MKLSEYMPEMPGMAQQMLDLNEGLNFVQLMKQQGDKSESPSIGLDHIVNTWVRHQMAYRQQLVQDLQTISYSVAEIRTALGHITGEVFRRGLEIHPKNANSDRGQLKYFNEFLTDANVFDQSLEAVFRQFHNDINTVDDGFLYLVKEYYDDGGSIKSKVKEIRRLNPALVEFDLDAAGLPKNAHFICPMDRSDVEDVPGKSKKGYTRVPAMYKYYHRNQHIYLRDTEIIHVSKFSPSETYGWSPILTVFEKCLTLIGMDKNIYRYFFERKMPASMLMVTTDDPESLRKEREHIAAQTRLDPNYIPMVAVSSRNQRGRVDMVRLFHTLQEMDYLPVKEEIRERVGAVWGVTPAWQGAPEAFGGLSTQTQQLVVMSRVVESDQRLFHEKVFPKLLKAFGITDFDLILPTPEEKAEATRISFAQQRVGIASQFAQLGFDIKLKEEDVPIEEAEFVISGEMAQTVQIQAQMQAMQLQQAMQQADQAQQQAAGGAGEVPPGGGGAPPGGGGGEALPMQAMEKSIPASERKFKGRTGGRTPDWQDKAPNEERDIDEWADKRKEKAENRAWGFELNKTWMQSLNEQGFSTPTIREVSPDGSQMWFIEKGVDYVADLSPNGLGEIKKATFIVPFPNQSPTNPTVSYDPSGGNQRNKEDEDDEDDN